MKIRIQSQNYGTERAVRFQMLEKTYIYPMHIHQFAELVIDLEGELEITVEGKSEILTPGRAALVFPHQPHGYMSREKNTIALFTFSPSVLPEFFTRYRGLVGDGAVFTPKESTLTSFRERIFTREDFELYDIKGSLYLTLADFLSEIPMKEGSAGSNLSASIVNYINEHLTDDIKLGDLASSVGYNPNYLSSCIQDIFGMNFSALIASIRADKAKYLLWETDKTGLEICYECGFGSERSFHRQFKAITGKTPKEYRAYSKTGPIHHGIIKYF